jgi:REP element-mobilizing transposase RayT
MSGNRKVMRLRNYDYACEGLYFLTVCVQHHKSLFGQVQACVDLEHSATMVLNEAGCMVERWYWEIERKFPDKRCHQMVVMPNHVHCIIENLRQEEVACGEEKLFRGEEKVAHIGATLRTGDETDTRKGATAREGEEKGAHIGAPIRTGEEIERYGIDNKIWGASMSGVMDWFKTMTTNEYIRGVYRYGWGRFDNRLWLRSFYDHIVRNDADYLRIVDYIENNPRRWAEDRFFAH